MCFSQNALLAVVFVTAFTFCRGLAADPLVSGKRLRPGQAHTQGAELAAQPSLLKVFEFKHSLRVCNAYPSKQPMEIFLGKQKITAGGPLAYQSCQDLKHAVQPDDSYDFKLGGDDTSVGTFSVSTLPNDDAVMLLVVHRHDSSSTSAAFESHVFSSNLPNAQVAVVDTFKGNANADLSIRRDTKDKADKANRPESLRYNSVVAVKPGGYECFLTNADGKEVAKKSLMAVGKGSYVVIRSGLEAQDGQLFPQTLTVFPASDPTMYGGTRRLAATSPSIMLIALTGCILSSFLLH